MRNLTVALVFAILTTCPALSRAADATMPEIATADHLYDTCQSVAGPPAQSSVKQLADGAWCQAAIIVAVESLGMVHGYFDAQFPNSVDPSDKQQMMRLLSLTALLGPDVCFPPDANVHVLALVISKYGREHPEQLTWSALQFAGLAFENAFPCTSRFKRQ